MSLPPPGERTLVIVTGASSGIGTELARELARRGHALALVARRRQRLEELAEELTDRHRVRVDVHEVDVGDREKRKAFITAVRRSRREVVGVCNNAGFGTFGHFHELPLEKEQEEVRVNVEALHDITGAFLPAMVKKGRGAVLNVGSIAGFQPQPLNATYAATKAFVNSFSEAVHTDLAGTGVSCTVLAPGPVRTEFADSAGVGDMDGAGPALLWADAPQVARVAVDAMERGRRTVLPTVPHRLMAMGGRFAPRTVMLPVMGKLTRRTLRNR